MAELTISADDIQGAIAAYVSSFEAGTGREMTTLFVPTAPQPTTGLIIAVPSEKVRDCDLTVEEGTKMLVSAGLVTPQRPLSVGPEKGLKNVQTGV